MLLPWRSMRVIVEKPKKASTHFLHFLHEEKWEFPYMPHDAHKDKRKIIQEQYESAYRNYAQQLFYYCRRRAKVRYYTCNDIVHEVFYSLWRHMCQNGPVENVQAYLFQAVRNKIVETYRQEITRGNKINLEQISEDLARITELSTNGKEETEGYILFKQIYKKLFQQFNETNRIILRLHFALGLPPREIAKRVDLNPDAISARIYRMRKHIAHVMEQHFEER